MKDYEKVAELEKKRLRLIDDRNAFNADVNGLIQRMAHEKEIFDQKMEFFNHALTERQKVLRNVESRITQIETDLNISKTSQVDNAHKKVGHERCQYCFQWFNKNGLASHEKHCGMNPDVIEKKPEKAAEKIEAMIDELPAEEDTKTARIKELKEQRAFYEAKLAELRAKTKHEEPPIEEIVKDKQDIANQMRQVADDMNGETERLKTIHECCQDWIDEYAQTEGAHAIWQGRVTKGFEDWCDNKGYELPQ
jgi:DNA repair exonuclease SbcCD ATPase subunit